jgi:hypothetical protein
MMVAAEPSFSILALLGLLVLGGIGVFALVALALMKGRPGVAALIGGTAFLIVLPCIGIVVALLAWSHSSVGMVEHAQMTANGLQYFPSDRPFAQTVSGGQTTWSIALRPALFIVCGGMALLVLTARRGLTHSPAGGRRRIWPAFLLLPVLALLFVGNARYRSGMSQTGVQRAAEMSKMIRQQHAAFAKQQQAMTKQVVATSANASNQIEQMDIYELMDKFDAPRIALQAPLAPTAGPAAMIVAAATTSNATPSEPSSAVEVEVPSPLAVPTPPEQPTVSPPTVPATSPQTPTVSRPAWIDDPPKRTGDVRREVIATEEYESIDECYQAADVYLMLKAYERLQQLAGRPYVAGALPSITFRGGTVLADGTVISTGRSPTDWREFRLAQLNRMGVGADYLRREVVAKDPKNNESREFVETVTRSFGPMKKLTMQIEFSPAVDRELARHWDAYYRQERFAMVGIGAASVLGLLTMVWGMLKVDTATKGYYTKRLFLGVPLGILGLFGLYVMLVEAGFDLPH